MTQPVEEATKPKSLLRRAAENPLVQTTFHALGGLGFGLMLAGALPLDARVVIGVVLMSAAILGHWYAVLTDPNRVRDK